MIIVAVLMLLSGPPHLPDLARSAGQAQRQSCDGRRHRDRDEHDSTEAIREGRRTEMPFATRW